MDKKLFALLAFAALFAGVAFAEPLTVADLGWFGAAAITLDKASFSDSETITGKVTFANNEPYPIVGGVLVLQLVEKDSSFAENSENENIFFEDAITGIWVLPGENKKVPFSIPAQSAGAYTLDVYLSSVKAPMVGESWNLYSPASKSISVSGQSAPQRAKINRKLTRIGDLDDGGIVSANPNELVDGKVFISNPSSSPKSGLKLKMIICDWTTNPCSSPVEQVFDVPQIAGGGSSSVGTAFNAPAMPSVYEIKLVLLEGNNVESIYKKRLTVNGGTAKPLKAFINGLDTKDYSLSVLASGAQDSAGSSFENFSVGMNLFLDAQKVDEKEVQVASLAGWEAVLKEFQITAQDFSKICVYTKKDGVLYGEECFDAPIKEIQAAYDAAHPPLVEVEWSYDKSTKSISLSLKKEIPINARIRIFSGDKTLLSEDVTGTKNYSKSIYSEPNNVIMTIDDFDAKRQQVFHLNLALPDDLQDAFYVADQPNNSGNLLPCEENLCGPGYVCSGKSFEASDGICCAAACVPAIESLMGTGLFSLPFIFWVSLIFLLIAIAIAVNLMRGKKK